VPIVQRFYIQQNPGDYSGQEETRLLSNYFEKHAVVILGGPGIGKTTELKRAAAIEPGSVFCSVSQFLSDPIDRFSGKTIYLDALDEHRAELHQGRLIIDSIRGRLLALDCPKFRLSCRGEEWHQGSDIGALSTVSGDEPLYILQMQPLREEDIRSIATEALGDADSFMNGAQEHFLIESLGNPQNLDLYLKVFKKNASWPSTRADLMKQSTEILIVETNENHERATGQAISSDKLMQAAEVLSAILLFGDSDGIALSRPAGTERYVPLQDLPEIDLEASAIVARRRLFASHAAERVYPQHKTTGDYLAAMALVKRIAEKSLPLTRALTLITGPDGSPPSHLRDVYAWLIALLPEHAEQLIKSDPFGAMIYGDVSQWSDETCRKALRTLSSYAATNDPWFRADAWYVPLLKGLARTSLVQDLRKVIRCEPSPHVTSVVLSALEYGKPLPELGDDLFAFVRDPGRENHDWLRVDALRVFQRNSPERRADRKVLLEDIKSKAVSDKRHMLCATLLEELYPHDIEPREVVRFFAEANISGRGTMDHFVRNELVRQTPEPLLPVLAEVILRNPDDLKRLGDFNRRKLNGTLIKRLLAIYGHATNPADVYLWLGIYMDRHHATYLEKDDQQTIRAFLESDGKFYLELFCEWLGQAVPDEKHGYRLHFHDYQSRILHASPPRSFPQELLALAKSEQDPEKAKFLFELAAEYIVQAEPDTFSVGYEELFDFVAQHSVFSEIWRKYTVTEIPDWRRQQAESEVENQRAKELQRAKNIESLSPRLEALRNGIDIQNLAWGARIWFGLSGGQKEGENAQARLQRKTNAAIADAIVLGFEALLKSKSPFSPDEIAKLDIKRKVHWECFSVLAGADIMSESNSRDFLGLPYVNLKAAFAFHLIHPIGGESRTWDKEIYSKRPDVARDALAEIWRAQLSGGKKDFLSELHIERTEADSTPLILGEIYRLLDEVQNLPPRILESAIKAVLCHGDAKIFEYVVPRALANSGVRGRTRALWLSVAALLFPDVYKGKLDRQIRADSRNVWAACEVLIAGAGTLVNGLASVPQLHLAISLLGKYFMNLSMSSGGRIMSAMEAAHSIRRLIDLLAGIADEEAAHAFKALIADPALHAWHDHLRHYQALQAKNLRDHSFVGSSMESVCHILAGGKPGSIADLQSVALNILDDIAARISSDSANLWKSFWTLGDRGKVGRAKIENDSRDVVLEWMRPYLIPRRITIEPEAAAVSQGRVDIRLTLAGCGTLPIEFKRDDNTELWTSMEAQLASHYAIDPQTGGHGIYVILWHGTKGNGCSAPPREMSIETPKSADELRSALEKINPSAYFSIRVIDVSPPSV
jgi:hypothetical protein